MQRESLVDRAAGEPIQLSAGAFEDGDAGVDGDAQRLLDPIVRVDALGDVQRRGGNGCAQCLDDRIAPGDGLRPVAVTGP